VSQAAIIIVRRGVQEYRARFTERETRLVGFDWTRVLQPGDQIAAANWAADDAALTVTVDDVTTGKTAAFVSGLGAGRRYRITNTIETTAGETRQAVIAVDVLHAEAAGAQWTSAPVALEWDDGEALLWDDSEEIEYT
jgi:hypothetical protein